MKKEFFRVLNTLGPEKNKFLFYFLLGLPLGLVKAAQAFLIKPLIDEGLKKGTPLSSILNLCFLLLGLAFLNYLFRYFNGYGLKTSIEKVASNLRSSTLKKILSMTPSQLEEKNRGDILNIVVNDISIYTNINKVLFDIMKDFISIFCLVFVLLYHSVQLTMICILVIPIYALILSSVSKKSKKLGSSVRTLSSSISSEFTQYLDGNKFIRVSNLYGYILKRFQKIQKKYLEKVNVLSYLIEFINPFVELIGLFVFSLILYFGVLNINEGSMSAGSLMSFISSLAILIDPIRNFTKSLINYRTWSVSGDRVYNFLGQDDTEILNTQKVENDNIRLEKVGFSYEEKILEDINLEISKGCKIALVGPSGSGKSTLIKIVLKFLESELGDVFIGSKNISQGDFHEFRNLFSYIPQTPYLFNTTIEENITLGRSLNQEKLRSSLCFAEIDSFISELEHAEQTIVGSKGASLSGGQAQRIVLARAIYQDSPILILDEGTSALDNNLDFKIQENLLRLNKTIINVSHRLSSIRNYDKIYYLENGGIIESGTHEELISSKNKYFNLYQLQG